MSNDTNEITREEFKALQRSVALVQSCVARIASFLESEKEDEKKRRRERCW